MLKTHILLKVLLVISIEVKIFFYSGLVAFSFIYFLIYGSVQLS